MTLYKIINYITLLIKNELTYQTAGDEREQESADDGTQKLSNPVEKSGDDGDLSTHGKAEGDGGVDVSTGDVGGDGDGHKESECMGNRYGH